MNKEICKKCKMYPDYFIWKYYLGHKKDIVKHYFYGYSKRYFEDIDLNPCLIIETSRENYSFFSRGKNQYSTDEIFSHKGIEPDKERCPYYAEHQLNDWNKEI